MSLIPKIADFVFGIGLFIHGFLFIPQIIKIVRRKHVKDLSILTFIGFNIVQIAAVIHGIYSKDYILTIGVGFSLLTSGTISILILYYSGRN